MENDGMENEEKKHGKDTYAIRLSLTSHFFNLLFPPKPKKTNKFRTGWSVTYKKEVEAVNRSVTKEATFQNLAVFQWN